MSTRHASATVDPAAGRHFEIRGLTGGYGQGLALHGIEFGMSNGEVVTLLGRNGAGKSSTLRAIMGLLPQRAGSIVYEGDELIGLPTRQIARRGLAYCPEERAIYASLTVQENLMLPPRIRDGGMSVEAIFGMFPNLRERLSSQGTKLSGGEQQMLAIARILRTGAKFLLLDEPTEGLAPVIVKQIAHTVRRLKAEGFTVLLVEQNLRFAASVADRHYVVEEGRVVDEFDKSDLQARSGQLKAYLGV